ncbi:MAG: glycosyltransferase family 4 protein, partial [Candidatus Ornithomonoglobus sp.]
MTENKTMKIAMLGHKRIPSREGGVEVVVDALSTIMTGRGHSVTAYNRMGDHVSGKEYGTSNLKEYKGVRLKKAFTINKKGLAAMTSSLFAALSCTFGNYDVVHFHAEGPCAMAWLPKLTRKRVVATIHGLDWQRAKWGGFATKYLKFGERMAVKYADEIIVLSKNVQKYFQDTYGRHTVFIPNGINKCEKKSSSLITEKLGLETD